MPQYSFIETVNAIRIPMLTRMIGGSFYLIGFILMAYNIWRTIRSGTPANGFIEIATQEIEKPNWMKSFFSAPVIYSLLIVFSACLMIFSNSGLFVVGIFLTIFFIIVAIAHFEFSKATWEEWYNKLLDHGFAFSVLTIIAAAIGGAIQIIPTVTLQRADNIEGRIQVPYTPLELAGRDIYVSEGCYNCHSQMIRTLVPDVLRYGRDDGYSHLGESVYDFPYQWGSKRTGPDLAREGGFRSDDWHYLHMSNPRSVTEGSTMPNYPWLFKKETKVDQLPNKINAMRMLGVPYPIDLSEEEIQAQVDEQAAEIVARLADKNIFTEPDKEIVALIAYLQKLGTFEVRK